MWCRNTSKNMRTIIRNSRPTCSSARSFVTRTRTSMPLLLLLLVDGLVADVLAARHLQLGLGALGLDLGAAEVLAGDVDFLLNLGAGGLGKGGLETRAGGARVLGRLGQRVLQLGVLPLEHAADNVAEAAKALRQHVVLGHNHLGDNRHLGLLADFVAHKEDLHALLCGLLLLGVDGHRRVCVGRALGLDGKVLEVGLGVAVKPRLELEEQAAGQNPAEPGAGVCRDDALAVDGLLEGRVAAEAEETRDHDGEDVDRVAAEDGGQGRDNLVGVKLGLVAAKEVGEELGPAEDHELGHVGVEVLEGLLDGVVVGGHEALLDVAEVRGVGGAAAALHVAALGALHHGGVVLVEAGADKVALDLLLGAGLGRPALLKLAPGAGLALAGELLGLEGGARVRVVGFGLAEAFAAGFERLAAEVDDDGRAGHGLGLLAVGPVVLAVLDGDDVLVRGLGLAARVGGLGGGGRRRVGSLGRDGGGLVAVAGAVLGDNLEEVLLVAAAHLLLARGRGQEGDELGLCAGGLWVLLLLGAAALVAAELLGLLLVQGVVGEGVDLVVLVGDVVLERDHAAADAARVLGEHVGNVEEADGRLDDLAVDVPLLLNVGDDVVDVLALADGGQGVLALAAGGADEEEAVGDLAALELALGLLASERGEEPLGHHAAAALLLALLAGADFGLLLGELLLLLEPAGVVLHAALLLLLQLLAAGIQILAPGLAVAGVVARGLGHALVEGLDDGVLVGPVALQRVELALHLLLLARRPLQRQLRLLHIARLFCERPLLIGLVDVLLDGRVPVGGGLRAAEKVDDVLQGSAGRDDGRVDLPAIGPLL
eukprot:m.196366 g.196366  ORF g.196366 m.196366 type:complete len:826 (+) comp17651_c0_seq2:291-2768(+)